MPASDSLGTGLDARVAQWLIERGVTLASRHAHSLWRARGLFDAYQITSGVSYGAHPVQRLDVWRPRSRSPRPRPLVLFFHGGGFQHLDRDSHWGFAERFASAGAVVMSADYRLAPGHRYPAAAIDAALAYRFAIERAQDYGADPDRLIVAGTSAGANLALGLALSSSEPMPHAHARRVFELGLAPRACVLFSGLLQVSDMARLYRNKPHPRLVRARMASISIDYLGQPADRPTPSAADALLDPLLYLEQRTALPARMAAVFASTGTRDPVLDDNVRLAACLAARGASPTLDVVDGARHAFQGVLLRRDARALWERCFGFLRARSLTP